MASPVVLPQFAGVLEHFRQRVPLHDELQERVSDIEALSMLERLPQDASDAKRMAQGLTFREISAFCRMLTLPQAEEARSRWEPVAEALSGKTYYLQLRSHFQFRFENAVLRAEFARCAAWLRTHACFLERVERLLKSSHDDLVRFTMQADPLSHLLTEFMEHRTLLGIYAADQGLLRHAPLFQRLRERWFMICDTTSYLLDGHELLQGLELAGEETRHAMLARFLQVHSATSFPTKLTHRLIELYGKPDESLAWEAAEMVRLENAPNLPDDKTMNGLHALNEWYMRACMQAHFGEQSLKLDVFTQFMPFLRHIRHDEARQALLLEYTTFTVVDFQPVPYFSWVCEPAELEIRYEDMVRAMLEQGGQEPGYRRKKIADARDFVIEQEAGAVVRLTFAEVGKLYATDMLSIRLGLMEREVWGVM